MLAIRDDCILCNGEVGELSREGRRPSSRSLVGPLERAITRKGSGGGKQVRCRRSPFCRALVDRGRCAACAVGVVVILKGRVERSWALGTVKQRKIEYQDVSPEKGSFRGGEASSLAHCGGALKARGVRSFVLCSISVLLCGRRNEGCSLVFYQIP